jgi:creatinine amidohydrolase/Fe(II)-dependent formamide hydrolase-like protein
MTLRPITEMRPREIVARRDASGCVFIPVSPLFEWHSWHLPPGVDGLVAEGLSALVAERVGGVYFPCLSFGLDQWREPASLARWGFQPDERIFGMNFPALPLASEYCQPGEMLKAVENRFECARRCGFRYAFIVNNHGGQGQAKHLDAFARSHDGAGCRVHYTQVQNLPTLERLGCGGHANLGETALFMAFRPDLVDLSELPEGEMSVPRDGMLCGTPTVPAEENPRGASFLLANELRGHLVEQLSEIVGRVRAGDPTTSNTSNPW